MDKISDFKGTVLVTALLVELVFLREHLISQLLEKGYTVRATARSTAKLQAIFPQATTAQLKTRTALKGAEALIHSASPVFGEGITGQDLYSGAYEGTVAVVKQSIAAGVSGTFLISKLPSVLGFPLRKTSIPSLRKLSTSRTTGCGSTKNPKPLLIKLFGIYPAVTLDVDFTVLLPSAIFGSQLSPLIYSPSSLGTNGFVKMLSAPEYSPIPVGHMIDVRDAARAHCPRAFDSPGSRTRQEVQHRQWDAKMERRHGVDQ
ncbi:hypothetical protein C8J55DRAFT_567638 [Lentinula edodes]|uniref:NAD(P)-binding protein n=1 Tax=Lentinula lateritia TaxID=40482 RepID=A0A9W8ZP41_9AGAR|nr:hypothetical protein C8J55DRAFT_567638 [Lentinula edodes]